MLTECGYVLLAEDVPDLYFFILPCRDQSLHIVQENEIQNGFAVHLLDGRYQSPVVQIVDVDPLAKLVSHNQYLRGQILGD